MRKLTQIEKQRYIGMFDEQYCINYLKAHIGEEWFIEEAYDEDDTEHFKYLLTIGENYDDELGELGYLMVVYARNKSELRNQAIDYQRHASEYCLSYGEIAYFSDYFTKLGKRFGLLKEFRENGVI